MSHPQVRFSIKVLPTGKGKPKDEDSCVYSPSKSVSEVVMKIFGKELMSCCIWLDQRNEKDDDGLYMSKVGLEAFLVRPGTGMSNFFPENVLMASIY